MREDFISRHPIEQVCAERGIKLIGSGNERMARCPMHADRKPSFCVTISKQLWTCYAGCGGGSVIDLLCKLDNISPHDFCVKHEIGNGEPRGFFRRAVEKLKPKVKPEIKSLFTPRTKIKPPEEEDSNIEKIYSYQDVFGLEVYQVVRYKPKDFRQRHREDDRWVWSMQNVERVLYHLPEVNQSPTVIVAEGERDCDSLVGLGFVATTNVGGAGKWLDSYSEHLEGKEIIICGDNDEPGQKHVRQVFDSVADKAKVVKILHLPKSVKDVSDYIATFKTPQEAKNSLEAIVGAAPPLIKGKELPIYGVWELERNYARHATMLADYSLDLSKMIPSWRGQVRPLVPGEVMTLVGDTGSCKTALTQAIFVSAIPMPTVLFELELPDDLMFERFVAMRRQMMCIDVERQYVEGRHIGEAALREEFNNLYVCTKSRLTIEQIDDYICRSELKIGERPKVVGIDYVQLVKGKGDGRRERIAQIAEDIKVLAKERNVIVIVTSQVARPKEGEKAIGLHSAKEAGEIESSSGFMLGFWRDEKNWQIIHSRILKMTKGKSGLETDFNFDGSRMMITERPKIDPADIPAPPPQVRQRKATRARAYPDD
jgi:5S rRNA maturation endonuclease (ribonuclease M5)